MHSDPHVWLSRFPIDGVLRPFIAEVLGALPEGVRIDLMGDPNFSLCDYDPHAAAMGAGILVPMASPGRGRPGRAVVLKRSLQRRPPAFVRWVIAHELAHALLRHEGRFPGEDPEHAADALAAEWGFPKPAVWPW